MAALAVHEPARVFDQDLVEMTAAARHARSGAVTVAARQAITTAGPCEPGDVLGAVDSGDLAERCARHIESAHPMVDVVLYDGGQERYPLLFGVE
jgi:dihydroxyacetone kinase-like predicted kinase